MTKIMNKCHNDISEPRSITEFLMSFIAIRFTPEACDVVSGESRIKYSDASTNFFEEDFYSKSPQMLHNFDKN
jgi:hypothetical protein